MRPNLRHGDGMASLGAGKTAGKRAASRRPVRLLAAQMSVLVALAAGIFPAPAPTAVDLQLVLAVHASGTVNQTRFELQRDGYVAAYRNARVLETIQPGQHQSIAVTRVQWPGPALQMRVVP